MSIVVCGVLFIYLSVSQGLPSVDALKTTEGIRQTLMPDEDRSRSIVLPKIEDIPAHVANAVILTYRLADAPRGFPYELFYPSGLILSDDLARRLLASNGTPGRHHLERAVLGIQIEYYLSREEIVAAWLASAYFGKNTYGVDAAARLYFGKPFSELNLCEAAMLAPVPLAPSVYNPIDNPAKAKDRQIYVLREMNRLGFADEVDIAACGVNIHK